MDHVPDGGHDRRCPGRQPGREEVKAELRTEGIPFDENVKVGIMIEIPSIAVISDLAAREVDFASVGTNDLTQYLHAVDRMNSKIIDYYQSMSPSMFRMLGTIFSEFNKAGKPISFAASWQEIHWQRLSCLDLVFGNSA